MGIEDHLIFKNKKDAEKLWAEISGSQYARSEAGIELTDSLIDFMKSVAKYRFLKGLPVFLMTKLVDKDVIEHLDFHVKHRKRYRILFLIVQWITSL